MGRTKRRPRSFTEYHYRVSQYNENVCVDCRWYHVNTYRCEVLESEVSKIGTCLAWCEKIHGGNHEQS